MKKGILALVILGVLSANGAVYMNASKSNIGPKDVGPSYDPSTVVTVMGTVTAIWETPKSDPLDGVYLSVRAGIATMDVYLGPTEFVKMFGVTFLAGDRIEIVGSQIMTDRGDLLLAAEVRVRGVTLVLRDKAGTPFWTTANGRP